MPERMDKASQERMLEALDTVSDLVEHSGLHPNDAVAKAAMDKKIPAGHVRLLTTAFNTGRSNFHRKTASSVLDKTVPVPLADPAVVMEKLYPSKEKSAAAKARISSVSSDYSAPYSFVELPKGEVKTAATYKVAEDLPKAENTKAVDKQFGDLRRHQIAVNEKAIDLEMKKQAFVESYKKACEVVRLNKPDNWQEIRSNLETAYGPNAELVLKHIDAANKFLTKDANAKYYESISYAKPVYKEIISCVQAMVDYRQAKEAHAVLVDDPAIKALREKLYPTLQKDAKISLEGAGKEMTEKGLGNYVSGYKFINSQLSKPVVESTLSHLDTDNKIDDLVSSLNSPEHETNLRKIRTKAMLHDLMANDDVISMEDPEKVVSTFNELQRFSPTLSGNPAMIRAVLRKALAQGGLDTHEFKTLAETERAIAKRPVPAPESGKSKSVKFVPNLLRTQVGGSQDK